MLDLPDVKTYGRLARDADDGRWYLSDCSPHVALRLKGMFPRIPKTDTGTFVFRGDDVMVSELSWFMYQFPMLMEPDDRRLLATQVERFKQTRQSADRVLTHGWKPGPLPAGFKDGLGPYDMQVQAADLAVMMGRLLIMDDVGLGKTVSALTAVIKARKMPVAIVVQSHLQTQWLTEYVMKFTTLAGYMIKTRAPYELPPADLYIFRESQLMGWCDVFAAGYFKTVIFDEIQMFRTGESTDKGKAARLLTDHAELRIGLSATPIYNLGGEMFDIMELIEPGCLGTRMEFYREWCVSRGNGKWIVDDPDALGQWLQEQHLVIRRDRAGGRVNKLLIEVNYEEEAASAQQDLARKLAIKTLQGTFMERGKASRELDIMLRQMTGLAKARSVAAYVRMILKSGKPVVLAGWHRECYRVWNEELVEFRPVMYTGSETAKQKDAAKAAFINGETDLFIISLRSGAGLDGLQLRCHTLVVGELDWSPKVHEQLIGRLDRPLQTADMVDAIFLWTDWGSDPLIIELLGLKASQSQGIVNPGQAPPPVRSDDSRLKLLAQSYLAQMAVADSLAA